MSLVNHANQKLKNNIYENYGAAVDNKVKQDKLH